MLRFLHKHRAQLGAELLDVTLEQVSLWVVFGLAEAGAGKGKQRNAGLLDAGVEQATPLWGHVG